MSLAPKLLGLCSVLMRRDLRQEFGGAGRILTGSLVETVFSTLLAPVLSISQTIFIASLAFGRPTRWASQVRRGRTVSVADAVRKFWPHTAIGAVLTLLIAKATPAALPWASPLIAGLLLAVPFTVITANRSLGRRLAAWRVCATPEELQPTREVAQVCTWLSGTAETVSMGIDRTARDSAPSPDPQPAS
jgi:membrane glycosyltransferase